MFSTEDEPRYAREVEEDDRDEEVEPVSDPGENDEPEGIFCFYYFIVLFFFT